LSSNYQIFETDEFHKKIEKISRLDKSFIEKKLLQHIYPQLREEPHYGNNIKKLIDYKPETWRYRIGKYRLFYVIEESEKTIYILSIDLRKDAYKKF
jgi:mRNA interferase RelE/StbE